MDEFLGYLTEFMCHMLSTSWRAMYCIISNYISAGYEKQKFMYWYHHQANLSDYVIRNLHNMKYLLSEHFPHNDQFYTCYWYCILGINMSNQTPFLTPSEF